MPRLVASKQIGDYRYEKYDLSGGSKPKNKTTTKPIYVSATQSNDDTSSDDSQKYEVQKRTIMRQRKPVTSPREKSSLCPIHGGKTTYFDRVLEYQDSESETESSDDDSQNHKNRRRREPASDDEISSGRYSHISDEQSEKQTRPRRSERRPVKQEMENGRKKPIRRNHTVEPERIRGKSNRYREASEDSEEERSPRQVQKQRKPVRKERRDESQDSEDQRPPRPVQKQRKPVRKERKDYEEDFEGQRIPRLPLKLRKPIRKEIRDNENESEGESPRRQPQRRSKPAPKPRRDYNDEYEEEDYRPSKPLSKVTRQGNSQSRGDAQYPKRPTKSYNREYDEDNENEEPQYISRKKDLKARKQDGQTYLRTLSKGPAKSAEKPRKPKQDYVEKRITTRSEYEFDDELSESESTSEDSDSSSESLSGRRVKPGRRSGTDEKEFSQKKKSQPPRNASYRI